MNKSKFNYYEGMGEEFGYKLEEVNKLFNAANDAVRALETYVFGDDVYSRWTKNNIDELKKTIKFTEDQINAFSKSREKREWIEQTLLFKYLRQARKQIRLYNESALWQDYI